MIDLTNIEKDTDRDQKTVEYAGKRFYLHLVELAREMHQARTRGITEEQMGIFAELDVESLVKAAKEMGNVPDWNDESLPKFEYKRDIYRER